jgi:hypothetical protein
MNKATLLLAGAVCALGAALSASPVFAQTVAAAAPKVDAADTAWMLGATGLVLMMTIPGLALFYAGMVRKKNEPPWLSAWQPHSWCRCCGRSLATRSPSPATVLT